MTPLMIDLPFACFWVEFNDQGKVVKAPPIARWMIGKNLVTVLRYVSSKGGSATNELSQL